MESVLRKPLTLPWLILGFLPVAQGGSCEKDATQLILLTIFMLLLCGISVSCVKFCCKKKGSLTQALASHPYEVTVIAIDNDSTVTSYNSVQFLPSSRLSLPFAEVDGPYMSSSPPPYSLYALELPPSYEEAVRMAKTLDLYEMALGRQKPSEQPGQAPPGPERSARRPTLTGADQSPNQEQ
ncbi:transmembrane protein 52 isoform X2 [Latimeria chalumnae]|uniref:transmembrane protein 52 isoform X2 n=1 Tax=Latimeria chalumnae TaxID=7897 RepID=UPI00313ED45C